MTDPADEPTAETAEIRDSNVSHLDTATVAQWRAIETQAPGVISASALDEWRITFAPELRVVSRRPPPPYRCADPKLRPEAEGHPHAGWIRLEWEPSPGFAAWGFVHPHTMAISGPVTRRELQPGCDSGRARHERIARIEPRATRGKRAQALAATIPLWHLPLTPAVLRQRIARLRDSPDPELP